MFDWKLYLHNYPDLMKNGIDTEKKATDHWNIHGRKEKGLPIDYQIQANSIG